MSFVARELYLASDFYTGNIRARMTSQRSRRVSPYPLETLPRGQSEYGSLVYGLWQLLFGNQPLGATSECGALMERNSNSTSSEKNGSLIDIRHGKKSRRSFRSGYSVLNQTARASLLATNRACLCSSDKASPYATWTRTAATVLSES